MQKSFPTERRRNTRVLMTRTEFIFLHLSGVRLCVGSVFLPLHKPAFLRQRKFFTIRKVMRVEAASYL